MRGKPIIWAIIIVMAFSVLTVPVFADDGTGTGTPAAGTTTETPSEESATQTAAEPAVDVPAVKTTVKSRTSVKVSWKKITDASGYVVYRYKSKYRKYVKIKTVTKKSTVSYTNSKLTSGAKYYYKVRAYEKSGSKKIYSSYSSSASATTPARLTQKTAGFWSTNAGKVIKKAKSKLGARYRYGASGPSSFDCSGYVYWVMKHSGVKTTKVPRTGRATYKKYKKYNIGTNVKNAQPGDIMMFSRTGSIKNITHVAFYYGSGKIIHASDYNTGVIVGKIGSRKTVAIIRLPNM